MRNSRKHFPFRMKKSCASLLFNQVNNIMEDTTKKNGVANVEDSVETVENVKTTTKTFEEVNPATPRTFEEVDLVTTKTFEEVNLVPIIITTLLILITNHLKMNNTTTVEKDGKNGEEKLGIIINMNMVPTTIITMNILVKVTINLNMEVHLMITLMPVLMNITIMNITIMNIIRMNITLNLIVVDGKNGEAEEKEENFAKIFTRTILRKIFPHIITHIVGEKTAGNMAKENSSNFNVKVSH